MKWYFLGLVFVIVCGEELKLAEPCDRRVCRLPRCRCSGTDIPGGLAARNTPQFVMITFDDAVNANNILTYREIMYQRRNSNGCPAGATFYIWHEWTDYQQVNELYNEGFEMALHSISHKDSQSYWAQATYEDMKLEFGDQKIQLAHFANIPYEDIKGIRIPYLQMTGNASFQVMRDYGIQYDSSWPTISYTNPGLWPYTLDYASTQDCVIPPCPTASIPGTWVLPMVSWLDLNGEPCAMADYCNAHPPLHNSEAWFQFIVRNFERQYLGNRSPFGFYVHEPFLSDNPAVKKALVRFMNMVNNMHDAFMVNSADVIEWVKHPVPLNEYVKAPCKRRRHAQCPGSICGPLFSHHSEMQYWMLTCNVCPSVYPWLGNPFGFEL